MARTNPKKRTRRSTTGRPVANKRARQVPRGGSMGGRGLRAWATRILLLGLVTFAGYAVWLDLTVRARFEGATWALPARLYARPLELYPGLRLTESQLKAELRAAGYHAVRRVSRPGSYSSKRGVFEVGTRAFTFWDGEEPARRLRVALGNGKVSRLSEAGRSVPIARLDPGLIGRIYPGSLEDRIRVKLSDVPPRLLQGLLAVEDRRFFEHYGISLRGIARAMWANLRAGRTVQGGSTLTQQLAKNLYLSSERSLWRKANEALIALILEIRYPKESILEAYINEIYLGQEGRRAIHGFGLASRFYFGRRLDELNLGESALLIGMVRGASLYNPRRSPKRAVARRALVLDVMAEQGIVDPAEAERAKATPLGILPRAPKGRSAHPAFVDLVRAQLARDYHDADLRSEGLQIFTTLEPLAQRRAEEALTDSLPRLERARRLPTGTLQGAVVLVRPASGEVVGLVGDRNPRAQGFNRAMNAVRPIGSLVKPAVYLAALESQRAYHLLSPLMDTPLTVNQRGQPPWSPQNYDRKYSGEISLMSALANSNNVATVRLGLDVGLGTVVRTLKRLGAERPVEEVPATLLGSVSLTPLEVAQVYQTLANDGFRTPLRTIREVTDAEGRPLSRYPLAVQKAADSGAVFLVQHALEQVVREGTARSALRFLKPKQHFAGKTGTTDGLRDSWFAGFNHELLGVAWVGRDDNKEARLTGASGALRIWGQVVPPLTGPVTEAVPEPEGIVWRWAVPGNASVAAASCPNAVRVPFARGSLPPSAGCDVITASGHQGSSSAQDDKETPGGDAG